MSLKRIFTFLTLTSLLNISIGQSESKLSVETQFDFLSKNYNASPNLKVRYFISDQNVVRLNLNFIYKENTREVFELDGVGVGTVQKTNSQSIFEIGYEKHMPHEKLSPYIGGSFSLGFGSNQEFGSRTDSTVFINDFNYSSKQNSSIFGINAFLGFDIYIYKGLFIGTEIGYSFNSINQKRGEFKTEDASSTTNASTSNNIPSTNTRNFALANLGIIRLGWKF